MNSISKLPITIVIPTLNAEEHLNELLDSVRNVVEDVFIVDSLSLDKTVDIALSRGIKIVQRPFKSTSDQFRWMLKQLPIRTPWTFLMAQDERFSPSLVEDLRHLFSTSIQDDIGGFTVKWRLWFMGKPLHAMTDNLRLMRTGRGDVTQVACNEHAIVEGRTESLKGILDHKDTLTLFEWYEKQNLWTTREAIGRIQDNSEQEKSKLFGMKLQRKMFFKRLVRKSFLASPIFFLYYYFGYGAWRDRRMGMTWALLRVWVHQVTSLKEREMRLYGVPKKWPEARYGDFDKRILTSALQRQLLPETNKGTE